jgi:hypothetical protein
MSNSKYFTRCQRMLKELEAPLTDWRCIAIEDHGTASFICELCGCSRVRYVHVMEHDFYFERISVGCNCAGVMEGNILAAKERERIMKNRVKRRQNFLKKEWKKTSYGVFLLWYGSDLIRIGDRSTNPKQYWVSYNNKSSDTYKDKPITSFLSATYAAFDLYDSVKTMRNA